MCSASFTASEHMDAACVVTGWIDTFSLTMISEMNLVDNSDVESRCMSHIDGDCMKFAAPGFAFPRIRKFIGGRSVGRAGGSDMRACFI